MAQAVLSRKTGVIVGDDVLNLFKYAQEKQFAIPAINVTSSSTVVAALEAARDKKAPIILQFSQGGAAFFAGKGVENKNQEASIAGAVAGALYVRSIAPIYGIPVILHTDHCAKKLLPWLDGMLDHDEKYFKEHGEPLFSSHMIDLSEEPVDWNIKTTAQYLKRAAPMKQWLEMVSSISSCFYYSDGYRKLVLLVEKKMVSTMRMSIITLYIHNQKISTRSTRPLSRSVPISQSPQVSEMFMAFTSRAMYDFIQSCLQSISNTSSKRIAQIQISQFSLFSMVDLDHQRKNSPMPSATVW